MGNGGGANSNPTALRTGGGRRLAGARTVAGVARLRRGGGGIQTRIDAARQNARRAARRVNRR